MIHRLLIQQIRHLHRLHPQCPDESRLLNVVFVFLECVIIVIVIGILLFNLRRIDGRSPSPLNQCIEGLAFLGFSFTVELLLSSKA